MEMLNDLNGKNPVDLNQVRIPINNFSSTYTKVKVSTASITKEENKRALISAGGEIAHSSTDCQQDTNTPMTEFALGPVESLIPNDATHRPQLPS